MKIGILGSGMVGRVLGNAFLTEGHEVMIGSGHPDKKEMTTWLKENANGKVGSFAAAATFGELLVLPCKGAAAEIVLNESGIENLSGKTIIDTTNPIGAAAPVNGVLSFFTDINSSLMEKLQDLAPKAHFVKAFNCVGNGVMYKPHYASGKPTMFICGNSKSAKQHVTDILDVFGWETEDMGTVEAARAIEPLCMLWCIPGFLSNQWNHAFKLLKS